MAPRRSAGQQRREENRRRREAQIPSGAALTAYEVGVQHLEVHNAALLAESRTVERMAGRMRMEVPVAQERAATRVTHAVYEAQLSHLEQNRAERQRVEEQAARSCNEAQGVRMHEAEQAAARQRAQQRATAAAAEESRVMIQDIEDGDTGLPSRIKRDMSWWSQDMLTYVDYAVPVYTLVPVIREDMCLFIRDDLATNELASRTISLPPQWDWSDGRGNLSDIVEHHVAACLKRLNELDDENDNDDQQRIAWARNPVYDPFSFLVLLRRPYQDEVKNILLVTLNDSRARCYIDTCLIPIEYAFDAVYALQHGEATWTGIKYLVAGYALQSREEQSCMHLLRLEVAHYVNFLKPERERAREYNDDNDPDSPNTPDEELDINATNLAEEVSPRRAVRRAVRMHLDSRFQLFAEKLRMPRGSIYVPFTFLLFYLEPPRGSIRPVQREWVYQYVNFITRRTARMRPAFIHNAGRDPGQQYPPVSEPGVLTDSEFMDRDWTWQTILRDYPSLLAEHVRRNSAVAQEFFLVWDHRSGGLLACRVLDWDWKQVYRTTPDEMRARARLRPRQILVLRMLPEIDVVDYLRQVICKTGLVRPWPLQVPDLVTYTEGDDDEDSDEDL